MTLDEYIAQLQTKQIEACNALKTADRAIVNAEIALANARDARGVAFRNELHAAEELKNAMLLKEKRSDIAFMTAAHEMLAPLDKMNAVSAITLYTNGLVTLHGYRCDEIRLTQKGEAFAAILRQLS